MATVLTPAEIRNQEDHISDNAVPNVIATNAACLSLAAIAVALRFICRRLKRIKYEADDWLILAGLILTAGFGSCGLISLGGGNGKHSILAPNIAAFSKSVIAAEVLHNLAIACIKLSVIRLYYRIFSAISRRFVLVLWGVASFVIGYSLANAVGAALQCLPFRSNWDPTVKHHCLGLSIAGTIFAAVNVLTDLIILILPMPPLARLRKPFKEKLEIMGIFCVGIFVCPVSIYRCVIIHQLTHLDPTWQAVPIDIWTVVELNVGIVCACIPTLRPLFTCTLRKGGRPERQVKAAKKPTDSASSGPSFVLHHKRSIPSQSRHYAHLGVLGDTIQSKSTTDQGAPDERETTIEEREKVPEVEP